MDSSPRSLNHLLSALPQSDFDLLRPHLFDVELAPESVLAKSDEAIERAYFPHSGVISLVMSLAGGEMVEIAMIGRDSLFGGAAALDGRISLSDAIVQVQGDACAIDIAPLRKAAARSDALRAVIVRHEEFLFAQAQQSAACLASHPLASRLARWLLQVRDSTGSNVLPLTQEFLGQMLGVQRSSVSVVANSLGRAGLISYHRGRIEITNPDGLADSACECYATVKARADRLLR